MPMVGRAALEYVIVARRPVLSLPKRVRLRREGPWAPPPVEATAAYAGVDDATVVAKELSLLAPSGTRPRDSDVWFRGELLESLLRTGRPMTCTEGEA